MRSDGTIFEELRLAFGEKSIRPQATLDGIPTMWADRDDARDVLRYLKMDADKPYRLLYDLTAIDERVRNVRKDQPLSDFTIVYHLLSFDRNQDVRIKVALSAERPALQTITDLWPAANWYEREVWDMFGVNFSGHPNLKRILMPPTWHGHPLRKEHPARATEMDPFRLPEEREDAEQAALKFRPEEWGLEKVREDTDFMFLNLGPQHPGTHGVLRLALQLSGEEIVDVVPDIGYHHRGAEKMGSVSRGIHISLIPIEWTIWAE